MMQRQILTTVLFLLNVIGGYPIRAGNPPQDIGQQPFTDQKQALTEGVAGISFPVAADTMLVTRLNAKWQRDKTDVLLRARKKIQEVK